MRILTVRQFADECGCTYEAIRIQVGNKIKPVTENPVTIDADKYDFIIKNWKNKPPTTK